MNEEEFFEISAVASLTGISSHVLRVWERRYSVVEPRRSETRRRQYTQADIERLRLLKSLVDHGHAIGSIAKLSLEKLEERVTSAKEAGGDSEGLNKISTEGASKIGLVGTMIRQPVREAADQSAELRIIGEFETIDEMTSSFQKGSVDILFLERDTIFREDLPRFLEIVENLGAQKAVIVYRFAQAEVFEALEDTKIIALRGPIEVAGIQLALGAMIQPLPPKEKVEYSAEKPNSGEIPSRVFSDEQLVRISKISPVVDCECPKHMSSLLRSLCAFEAYSEQCENRDQQDAALHAFLHLTTAQVRNQMEKALAQVMAQEGISY